MNIDEYIKFMEINLEIQQEKLYDHIIKGKSTREIDDNIEYLEKRIKEMKKILYHN